MRVVLDTNILVSTVIRDRLPEKVLLWCLGKPDVEWLVTPDVMAEGCRCDSAPQIHTAQDDGVLVAGAAGSRYLLHPANSNHRIYARPQSDSNKPPAALILTI